MRKQRNTTVVHKTSLAPLQVKQKIPAFRTTGQDPDTPLPIWLPPRTDTHQRAEQEKRESRPPRRWPLHLRIRRGGESLMREPAFSRHPERCEVRYLCRTINA